MSCHGSNRPLWGGQSANSPAIRFGSSCCSSETATLVKADRSGVVRIDSADHDVLAERGGPRQQLGQEHRTDAATAAPQAHVHRVLDREAIARPGAEVAEARVAEHAARV